MLPRRSLLITTRVEILSNPVITSHPNENNPPSGARKQPDIGPPASRTMDANQHPPRTSSKETSLRRTPQLSPRIQDVQGRRSCFTCESEAANRSVSNSSPSLRTGSFDSIAYGFLPPTTQASTHGKQRKVSVDPKKYTPSPSWSEDELMSQRYVAIG